MRLSNSSISAAIGTGANCIRVGCAGGACDGEAALALLANGRQATQQQQQSSRSPSTITAASTGAAPPHLSPAEAARRSPPAGSGPVDERARRSQVSRAAAADFRRRARARSQPVSGGASHGRNEASPRPAQPGPASDRSARRSAANYTRRSSKVAPRRGAHQAANLLRDCWRYVALFASKHELCARDECTASQQISSSQRVATQRARYPSFAKTSTTSSPPAPSTPPSPTTNHANSLQDAVSANQTHRRQHQQLQPQLT